MVPETHAVLGLLEGGFSQLKVLVVGDLMLDRYILGEVDRISPEAPVPVLRRAQRYERAGGAANVAMNVVGLGCQALLAGFWGEDIEGAELAGILKAANIDTTAVVTTRLPTTSKTRIVGRGQQLMRLDVESNDLPADAEQELRRCVLPLIPQVQAVILSDYAKGALTVELCEAVIRVARAAGVPVLADPKTPNLGKYSGATAVCPNLHELSIATGVTVYEFDALLRSAEKQRVEHELKHLCITMSEKGICVLSDAGKYNSQSRAREVFDVSGAGDTVIATLAAALAGGLRMETAVDLANLAAGIVVGKVGTAAIECHELKAALVPLGSAQSVEKVLDDEQLVKHVAKWRAAGETIVFTNGCFDLLHVGHVTLLETCRQFGSKLVLGLNTDSSVCRLKGPARPMVGQHERARVISAMATVDAVVLFDDETPIELIRTVKPDVLVKGGDYSVEAVVGHKEVIEAGGRVEIVPTVQGFSSTSLVHKMSANR